MFFAPCVLYIVPQEAESTVPGLREAVQIMILSRESFIQDS